MLDYRFHTFLILCQEKSYTSTAETLFITQPAVTQHIQWLENKYQTKLVDYHNREFALTSKGRELYHYLRSLEAQTERIDNLMKQPEKNIAPLKFATTLSISVDMLPTMMDYMMAKQPERNISCLVENTESILTKLRKGIIDFALVEGNFPKNEFTYHELSSQRFVAISAQNSLYDSKKRYGLEELLGETLITREDGSGTRKILDTILREQNFSLQDFHQLIELGSFHSIKHLTAQNKGIAFLYEAVVKEELETGQLKEIHIKHLNIYHPFYFIYLKDSIFQEEYLQLFNDFHQALLNTKDRKSVD